MANTITHKRSSTSSETPSASDLSAGEIAINTADGKLFIKKSDNNIATFENSSSFSGSSNITTVGTLGQDLTLKTNDGAILTLQTSDTTVEADDSLGEIHFQAPDEADGSPENAVVGKIINKALSFDFGSLSGFATNIAVSQFDFQTLGVVGTSTTLKSRLTLDWLGTTSLGTFKIVPEAGTALMELHNPDTEIEANDVLGVIKFKAPKEASGSQAVADVAQIRCVASSDFTSTSASVQLRFGTRTGNDYTESLIVEDSGVSVQNDDSVAVPYLKIKNVDTTITANQSIGKIEWQAPNEASGGVTDDVTAKIDVVAVSDFNNNTTNKSKFDFYIHEDSFGGNTLNKVFSINPYGRIDLINSIGTNVGGTSDPHFSFIRGGGGSGDELGTIFFKGDNNSGNQVSFASIRGKTLNDGTGGTVTGSLHFDLASQAEVLKLEPNLAKVTGALETTGNIELGNSSDTTLSRASAGVMAVEGNEVLTSLTGATKGFATAMAIAL